MSWTAEARAKSHLKRVRNCRSCGTEMIARSAKKKFCADCLTERRRRQNEAWREENRHPKPYEPKVRKMSEYQPKSSAKNSAPCRACGKPTGGADKRKKFCDPCKAFRRLVQNSTSKAKHSSKTVQRDWRDPDAPLTDLDREYIADGLGSECYSCKYLAMCRANVWNAGYKMPCFEER